MKNKLRKTDFRLVVIDESKDWGQDIVKACGGKIETVYLYDANVTTCLSEVTPSYYLTPLYCISAKNYNDINADMQINFDEGQAQCESMYAHCNTIDNISIKPQVKNLDGTFTTLDGKKYKELFDNAFEYLAANHQI